MTQKKQTWGLNASMIAPVNVNTLKTLSDLGKYAIHPVFVDCIMVGSRKDLVLGCTIDAIEDCLQNDPHDVIKYVYQAMKNPKHKLNHRFYRALCFSKDAQVRTKAANNRHALCKRMLSLHLKECKLLQTNPCDSSLQYIFKQQLNPDYSNQCVICYRGCYLFNQVFMRSRRTIPFQTTNEYWNYMVLLQSSMFEFCPFHMQLSIKNKQNQPFEFEFEPKFPPLNYNDYISKYNKMVRRYVEYNDHNSMHTIFLDLIVTFAKYAQTMQLLKLLEIGKIILNCLTAVMKECTSNDGVRRKKSIQLLANLVKKEGWDGGQEYLIHEILKLYFPLLFDLQKIDIGDEFGKQQRMFSLLCHKKNINLDFEKFDCIINQDIPSNYDACSKTIRTNVKELLRLIYLHQDECQFIQLHNNDNVLDLCLSNYIYHSYEYKYIQTKQRINQCPKIPNNLNKQLQISDCHDSHGYSYSEHTYERRHNYNYNNPRIHVDNNNDGMTEIKNNCDDDDDDIKSQSTSNSLQDFYLGDQLFTYSDYSGNLMFPTARPHIMAAKKTAILFHLYLIPALMDFTERMVKKPRHILEPIELDSIHIDHVLGYAMSYIYGDHATAKIAFKEVFTRLAYHTRWSDEWICVDQARVLINNGCSIYMDQLKYLQYFLCYAMFLCNIKSKKACKYFEFCLKLRPFCGYIHYQYAIYLCDVIKDYKLSYFHLKIAKKLQTNSNKYSYRDGDEEKTNNSLIFMQYRKYMKILIQKFDHKHLCDYVQCNRNLSILNTCKSCRSVFYCSKKCQKKDWVYKHKNQCISKYCNALSKKQIHSLSTAQLIFCESLKKYLGTI